MTEPHSANSPGRSRNSAGRALFSDIVVNGRRISKSEIATETQHHSAPSGKPGMAWNEAARALVVRELMLQEADRQGIRAKPRDFGNGRTETETEARIRALLEQRISASDAAESDLRAEYEANPERFQSPALYEASHILIAAGKNDPDSNETARRRAHSLLQALLTDPDRFDAVARAESDCPSGKRGGRLGQFSSGDMVPEFEAELHCLAPGEIAGRAVQTEFGFHILRLDARAAGRALPFEAVRGRIGEAKEKEEWIRAGRDFVAELIRNAEITGIGMRALQGAREAFGGRR